MRQLVDVLLEYGLDISRLMYKKLHDRTELVELVNLYAVCRAPYLNDGLEVETNVKRIEITRLGKRGEFRSRSDILCGR